MERFVIDVGVRDNLTIEAGITVRDNQPCERTHLTKSHSQLDVKGVTPSLDVTVRQDRPGNDP